MIPCGSTRGLDQFNEFSTCPLKGSPVCSFSLFQTTVYPSQLLTSVQYERGMNHFVIMQHLPMDGCDKDHIALVMKTPRGIHHDNLFFASRRMRRAAQMFARASSESHPLGLRSPPMHFSLAREICFTASQKALRFSRHMPFLSHEWLRGMRTWPRLAIGGSRYTSSGAVWGAFTSTSSDIISFSRLTG